MEKNNNSTTYGILSLSFSILGFFVAALIFEPLALVFGILGQKNSEGTGMVLSVVGTVLSVIALVIFFFMLMIALSYR